MTKETYGLAALLNSACLVACGPIVDFSRFQKARFDVEFGDDIGREVNQDDFTFRIFILKW